MTILYFIIAIGILILVHELGHFIMARRNDIRVEKFSIGFGPALFSFKRGETEYKLAPIPLGGYVKMTGEDPEEEANILDDRSFARKSVWARIKVTSAGPITNLLFAFLIMPLVFMIGRMEPAYLSEAPILAGVKTDSPAYAAGFQKGDLIKKIDDKAVSTWDELQKKIIMSTGQRLAVTFDRSGSLMKGELEIKHLPELKGGYAGFEPMFFYGNDALIDRVAPDGPAEKAGLHSGDRVVAINDKPIEGWFEMSQAIHGANGKPVLLTVDRGGEKITVNIEPTFNKDADRWVIGVIRSQKSADIPMINRKYDFLNSVKSGFKECVGLMGLTLEVLKKLFTLELSYKSLGGPIQIAQVSAIAAKSGIADFIYFIAFLSIQLGMLNLLPIPVLDGGHIAFCGLEALIRRPVPVKVRSAAQYVGLAFILSILLLVTVNDIDSVWGIKKLLGR